MRNRHRSPPSGTKPAVEPAIKPAVSKFTIPPFLQAILIEMITAMLKAILEQIRSHVASGSTRVGEGRNEEAKRALDVIEEAFRYAIISMEKK